MAKKLTEEDVIRRLEARTVSYVSGLKGSHQKARFACDVCSYEWETSVSSILYVGSGCPYCANQIPLTEDVVRDRLKDRTVSYVSGFKVVNQKAKFSCDVCEYEWEAITGSILHNSRGCPSCSNRLPLTEDVVRDRLKERTVSYVSGFKRVDQKARFVCDVCSYGWETNPNNVLNQGHGCPSCSNRLPLTEDVLRDRLKERTVSYVSGLRGSQRKAKFSCDVCEYEWESTPDSIFHHGNGCPFCARDRCRPVYIYLLEHPEVTNSYIGLSYDPESRLQEHKYKSDPETVDLFHTVEKPYVFTNQEVHDSIRNGIEDGYCTPVVEDWLLFNDRLDDSLFPEGRMIYADFRQPHAPAKLPLFIAEWVEDHLIKLYDRSYKKRKPSNPYITAGQVPLLNHKYLSEPEPEEESCSCCNQEAA